MGAPTSGSGSSERAGRGGESARDAREAATGQGSPGNLPGKCDAARQFVRGGGEMRVRFVRGGGEMRVRFVRGGGFCLAKTIYSQSALSLAPETP